MDSKVKVGVTSATGYGVTLAAVVAAALDYIGGDHSQPTRTTLYLGIVAGVSYVVTQVGRYAQAHAQAKAVPGALSAEQLSVVAEHVNTTMRDAAMAYGAELHDEVAGTGEQDIGAINSKGEAVYFDPPPDLVDEPEDDGSDGVPEHEQRDLHDGGRC